MRLYIAGPMTGLPDLNYPKFNQWAEALRNLGHDVENPAENPECPSWEHYMRLSVIQIANCEGIALLDGWEKSRGARFEVYLAGTLGLEIKQAGEWV